MWFVLVAYASAADSWSEPQPGVQLLQRVETGGDPQRIFVAFVDLCEGGMTARATTYEERGQTTSDWAEDVGAIVAINGAFFSYTDYDASGWSIGEGESWPTASDNDTYGAIGFGPAPEAEIFGEEETLPPAGEWLQVVPGYPILIEDGVIIEEDCFSHMCERHPRTAVGLTADEGTVILAAVDGRSDSAEGMTRLELAELMADLGAHQALNLDGGGSTTLYVGGLGVVNDPSDGSERVVASHLGFRLAGGDSACCVPEAADGASGVFGDIPDDHWGIGYAEALYAAGVTSGCQDDPPLFCPDCALDRGTLAVLLARAMGLEMIEGESSFSDVEADDWRGPAIEALAQAGITSGCGDGLFCPDAAATRWEAAALIARGMGLEIGAAEGLFGDLSAEQAPYVEALAAVCVVSGCDEGLFCPDGAITRIEAAKMLAVGFSVGGYGPCTGGDTGEPADSGDGSDEPPPVDEVDSAEPAEVRGTRQPAADGCGGKAALVVPLVLLAWRRRP